MALLGAFSKGGGWRQETGEEQRQEADEELRQEAGTAIRATEILPE